MMEEGRKLSGADTDDRLIHSETYTVRSYETGVDMKAHLSTLIRYMQETAWHHAHALGVGYDHLIADDLAWVLMRLTVKVDRYPDLGENIIVKTWPSAKNRLLCMRDFEIGTPEGETIAKAASGWLVMNILKRRPVNADLLKDIYSKSYKRALPEDPEKLPKLTTFGSIYDKVSEYTVQYTDLDANRHVNNARFADFVINAHPGDVLEKKHIQSFEISYAAEAVLNDRLMIYSQNAGDDKVLQSMVRLSDRVEICRSRISFIN